MSDDLAESALVLNGLNSARRTAAYVRRWGPAVRTWSAPLAGDRPFAVHAFEVDVAVGSPLNGGRPFHVLLTDGMSNEDIVPDVPRTELVWYVQDPLDVHIEWLRALATMHLVDHVDLYQRAVPMVGTPGHVPPLAEGSGLSWVTALDPPLAPDRDEVEVGGTSMGCLWVLPITAAERALVAKRGIVALTKLLQKHDHPRILEPGRPSYV